MLTKGSPISFRPQRDHRILTALNMGQIALAYSNDGAWIKDAA